MQSHQEGPKKDPKIVLLQTIAQVVHNKKDNPGGEKALKVDDAKGQVDTNRQDYPAVWTAIQMYKRVMFKGQENPTLMMSDLRPYLDKSQAEQAESVATTVVKQPPSIESVITTITPTRSLESMSGLPTLYSYSSFSSVTPVDKNVENDELRLSSRSMSLV